MLYSEVFPDEKLKDIIYCYWELKTTELLEQTFIYRVVADGCIDIFFQLDDPSENYVMGFCKKYTEFPLDKVFHYVGIRFFPSIFPALFNIKAKELSNRSEKLELVLKDTSAFIKNSFTQKNSFQQIKAKLDNYFTTFLAKRNLAVDLRFQNALYITLKKQGAVNIQTELATCLSRRQLNRYFEFYIGDAAKSFSQVVRFQNILNAKSSANSFNKNKTLFDLGYYDQAHFIKEFKKFYGATPSKVLSR